MSYPRHRTRSNGNESDLLTVTGDIEETRGPFQIRLDSESMDDWVTPGFSEAIASGKIINNPCVYQRTRVSQQGYPGSRSVTHESGSPSFSESGPLYEEKSSSLNPVLTVDEVLPFDLVGDRCRLEAIAYIDSTPYAFGEDIGELGQTFRFLRNPVGSIFNLSKAFKSSVKSKKRSGLKRSKAIADVWLEYRFAFSPLVRSCSDLLESFSETPKTYPVRLSSHGKDSAQVEGSATSDRGITSSTLHFSRSMVGELEGHASVLYEVSNPIRDWRFRYGLRGKDLPTTFWQLIPLSFMVDRLVDISSFSRGAINLADPSVNILAGSYTSRHEYTNMYTFSETGKDGWSVSGSPNVRVEKSFMYRRTLWTPSVSDTIPRIEFKNVVNSATKIADLVALTIANLR